MHCYLKREQEARAIRPRAATVGSSLLAISAFSVPPCEQVILTGRENRRSNTLESVHALQVSPT